MAVEELRLMRKRSRLVENSREILERVEKDGRAMAADEQEQFDRFMTEITGLTTTIEAFAKQRALEKTLEDRGAALQGRVIGPQDARPDQGDQEQEERRKMDIFHRYLVAGRMSLTPAEFRAIQADDAEQAGFIVAPKQFITRLIQAVDDLLFVRAQAETFTVTSAASLGAPSLDADPEDGTWSTEIKAVDFDTQMDVGARDLHPHPLVKGLKVANKLLRLAALGPESIVIQRLAYKLAVTMEKAYLTGNGSGQPLGVFTASAQGVSTGRDVVCGTTTDFTMDGLIDMKYSLKAPYWARGRWMFHRTGVQKVAKLKDGNNQYLWQASTQLGQPDRLLGFPIDMSEYCPNTFTASQYVALLGDWRAGYWIVDALTLMIQKLDELYAETRQTGFIAELETDGMPVLEEAFVRGITAAA